MKKLMAVIMIFGILFCTGCEDQEVYTFFQPSENISRIEIIYVDPYSKKPNYTQLDALVVIEKDQWDAFIAEFCKIPCYTHFLDPALDTSGNVIRITYSDGGCEIISDDAALHISSKKEYKFTPFYFDREAFGALIDSVMR